MMNSNKRKRLFVDPQLQGGLLYRVVLYWTVCILVMVLLASVQVLLSSREAEWPVLIHRILLTSGPALIASLVLLPFLVFDAIRFSHRFAGPMKRLRTVTEKLAEGQWDGPVNFREGDYWHDLAKQIDRIGEELDSFRTEQLSPSEEAEIATVAAE